LHFPYQIFRRDELTTALSIISPPNPYHEIGKLLWNDIALPKLKLWTPNINLRIVMESKALDSKYKPSRRDGIQNFGQQNNDLFKTTKKLESI